VNWSLNNGGIRISYKNTGIRGNVLFLEEGDEILCAKQNTFKLGSARLDAEIVEVFLLSFLYPFLSLNNPNPLKRWAMPMITHLCECIAELVSKVVF
jgi:hypothetical protein